MIGLAPGLRILSVQLLLSAASALTVIGAGSQAAAASDLAAGEALRAVYLGGNPAQVIRDPVTGKLRGPSYELAQGLARHGGQRLEFRAVDSPAAVIEAVRTGKADIGFVAYEASRLGTVDFSQTYMQVEQSFLVLSESPIERVDDIYRPGMTIGGSRGNSITLCLKRTLRGGKVVEIGNSPVEIARALGSGVIDAFGANRQRLTTLQGAILETRILPDNLFSVPQNVVVPKNKTKALAVVNTVIDEFRVSGQLASAIDRSGSVGVTVAPVAATVGCSRPAP